MTYFNLPTMRFVAALVVIIILATEGASVECEQRLPRGCSPVDPTKAPLHLKYEIGASRRKIRRLGNVLWFRFANNSTCDAYIPTLNPYRSGIRTRTPVRTTRDRERVEIVYVLDEQWGWGHAFGAFIVKSGRSILFALPRDELAGRSTLWVPVAFDLDTPFTSLDISRVCFRLSQLPPSTVKE